MNHTSISNTRKMAAAEEGNGGTDEDDAAGRGTCNEAAGNTARGGTGTDEEDAAGHWHIRRARVAAVLDHGGVRAGGRRRCSAFDGFVLPGGVPAAHAPFLPDAAASGQDGEGKAAFGKKGMEVRLFTAGAPDG
jgi:hypothetical protein